MVKRRRCAAGWNLKNLKLRMKGRKT